MEQSISNTSIRKLSTPFITDVYGASEYNQIISGFVLQSSPNIVCILVKDALYHLTADKGYNLYLFSKLVKPYAYVTIDLDEKILLHGTNLSREDYDSQCYQQYNTTLDLPDDIYFVTDKNLSTCIYCITNNFKDFHVVQLQPEVTSSTPVHILCIRDQCVYFSRYSTNVVCDIDFSKIPTIKKIFKKEVPNHIQYITNNWKIKLKRIMQKLKGI